MDLTLSRKLGKKSGWQRFSDMKRCFFVSVILLSGCAVDDELASTDQSSTIVDQCAVGHAINAEEVLSAGSDSYARSATTMDLTGPGRCDCINWQGVFDVSGEAAADAAYPTCRPEAIYSLRVKALATDLAHYTVFSEFTDKVHTQADCTLSKLHMELWRQTGPDTWQEFWWGTQTAHWDAGRCYQTVGEAAPNKATPNMANGFYRIHAVATPAGEQGYDGIVLSGGLL
jgi:hypothetical protein